MKLFRTLLLVFCILSSAIAFGQDSYRQSYKKFIEACPSRSQVSASTMRVSLSTLNQALMKQYDKSLSDDLIETYLNEQFFDDVADAIIPFYQKGVSENDLQEVTRLMLQPAGKQFQEHLMAMYDIYHEQMLEMGQQLAFKLIDGGTPDPVSLRPDISQDYILLFNKYYDAQNMAESTESMVRGLQQSASGEQMSIVADGLASFLRENLKNIMLNSCSGLLTESDLQFGIALSELPAWKHIQQVSNEIFQNPLAMGMSVVVAYQGWLAKQGVELNM